MADVKDLEYFLALPWSYTLETWTDSGGYYVFRVNDLPNVVANGKTVAEAFENVRQAMTLYFQTCLDEGRAISEPLDPAGVCHDS